MEAPPGHYGDVAAGQETVRSCTMAKCKSRAEMTRPPVIMAGSNKLFEDISALANLIMLQEMMLGEEYQMIAGSSMNLATPAAPTLTVRNAQSNETALNTGFDHVAVSAVNYFGQTAASTTTATDDRRRPGRGRHHRDRPGRDAVQHLRHRLLDLVPAGHLRRGEVHPPGVRDPPHVRHPADHRLGDRQADPDGRRRPGPVRCLRWWRGVPVGLEGGYFNGAVGQHLNYNIVYTTLKALWDSSTGSTTNGPFKADPAEIISSGSDLTNLSQDVISQGSAANYELFIQQCKSVTSPLAPPCRSSRTR